MQAGDRVQIGTTGVRVSRLGLGGTALSGVPPALDPHLVTSLPDAVAIVERSMALGLNYFDTAPMYGLGESERRIGQALQIFPRDQFVISSKVGRVLRSIEGDDAKMTWAFDFGPRGVVESFESSLDRLGLDHIDILYLHDPDGDILFSRGPGDYYEQALAEAVPMLMDLRANGRVSAIGVGMNQWEMELQFARAGQFDCFLLAGRYTLLDQTALYEFLPYCAQHNISVIAGGPFNSGILAVGAREGATFNYKTAPTEALERARLITGFCDKHSVPLRAAALQFILAHPAIASVIPGARSLAEVEDNVKMVEFPIPRELWADLKQEGLIDDAAPTPGQPDAVELAHRPSSNN